jgi:hypothetical protein
MIIIQEILYYYLVADVHEDGNITNNYQEQLKIHSMMYKKDFSNEFNFLKVLKFYSLTYGFA